MPSLRALIYAYLAIVGLVLAGIGTGYFNKGPVTIARAPVPPPTATPAAAPARPSTSAPGPAPTGFRPGESVDGAFVATAEMCAPPCSAMKPMTTELAFRLMLQADGHVVIIIAPRAPDGAMDRPNPRDPSLYGVYDAQTGRMSGTLVGPDIPAVSRWSGVLTRQGGALQVEGQLCIAYPEGAAERATIRNAGARFWGPATRPMPNLPAREPGCPPDDPALAGLPLE